MLVSLCDPLRRPLGADLYRGEVTQGEHTEQTCLSASTIAYYDKLPGVLSEALRPVSAGSESTYLRMTP